jgi:hypothetical protein
MYALNRRLWAAFLVPGCISCATDSPGTADQPAPPAAEFLLVAGDSTFWVRSDTAGIRVRGSAILLARIDGRFHEIYIADDDRSFYDAVFVGQRIYRRDIERGDSVAVLDDRTVPALATAYASAHPSEQPLSPGEDGSDRPATIATTEIAVADLHGPYLSYEYRADLDVVASATMAATDAHLMRRGVIDLRTGKAASLEDLFGHEAGRRMTERARREQRAMQDSVRASADPRATIASLSLNAFKFDAMSFNLAAEDGKPAVLFAVPGEGEAAGGLALPLPPIPASSPKWWIEEVVRGLPSESDVMRLRWRRPGYEVVVRQESDETVMIILRDPTRRAEWKLARTAGPAHHIFWLDRPRIDDRQRAALTRAFDEAAYYGGEMNSASNDTGRDGAVRILPARWTRR